MENQKPTPGAIPYRRSSRALHNAREITMHELAAHWPVTADIVSLGEFCADATVGKGFWGLDEQRTQPVRLSASVATVVHCGLRTSPDKMESIFVDYGALGERLHQVLTARTWRSGLELADLFSQAIVASGQVARIKATQLHICFPAALERADSAGVQWTLVYDALEGQVQIVSRQLYVKAVKVRTLIGVYADERKVQQELLVSVWVDRVWDEIIDGYNQLEHDVVKAVQDTRFHTIEALAEDLARKLFASFLKDRPLDVGLKIRVQKPIAQPVAYQAAVEIYREQHTLTDPDGKPIPASKQESAS